MLEKGKIELRVREIEIRKFREIGIFKPFVGCITPKKQWTHSYGIKHPISLFGVKRFKDFKAFFARFQINYSILFWGRELEDEDQMCWEPNDSCDLMIDHRNYPSKKTLALKVWNVEKWTIVKIKDSYGFLIFKDGLYLNANSTWLSFAFTPKWCH